MCELWSGVIVAPPLTGFKDGFAEWLTARRYAPKSTAGLIRVMADLARWMAREGVSLDSLTWPEIDRYVGYRQSAGYAGARTRGGLAALTDYLRAAGAPLEAFGGGLGGSELTADFGGWMIARGVSERAAGRHVWWIDKLVAGDPVGAGEPGWLTVGRIE